MFVNATTRDKVEAFVSAHCDNVGYYTIEMTRRPPKPRPFLHVYDVDLNKINQFDLQEVQAWQQPVKKETPEKSDTKKNTPENIDRDPVKQVKTRTSTRRRSGK